MSNYSNKLLVHTILCHAEPKTMNSAYEEGDKMRSTTPAGPVISERPLLILLVSEESVLLGSSIDFCLRNIAIEQNAFQFLGQTIKFSD